VLVYETPTTGNFEIKQSSATVRSPPSMGKPVTFYVDDVTYERWSVSRYNPTTTLLMPVARGTWALCRP
jgi:hypothetical protein